MDKEWKQLPYLGFIIEVRGDQTAEIQADSAEIERSVGTSRATQQQEDVVKDETTPPVLSVDVNQVYTHVVARQLYFQAHDSLPCIRPRSNVAKPHRQCTSSLLLPRQRVLRRRPLVPHTPYPRRRKGSCTTRNAISLAEASSSHSDSKTSVPADSVV